MNHVLFSQGTLALAAFGGQDMASVSLFIGKFSACRAFEPFCGRAIGLDFRHCRILSDTEKIEGVSITSAHAISHHSECNKKMQ
jgi:hypothetical protein